MAAEQEGMKCDEGCSPEPNHRITVLARLSEHRPKQKTSPYFHHLFKPFGFSFDSNLQHGKSSGFYNNRQFWMPLGFCSKINGLDKGAELRPSSKQDLISDLSCSIEMSMHLFGYYCADKYDNDSNHRGILFWLTDIFLNSISKYHLGVLPTSFDLFIYWSNTCI